MLGELFSSRRNPIVSPSTFKHVRSQTYHYQPWELSPLTTRSSHLWPICKTAPYQPRASKRSLRQQQAVRPLAVFLSYFHSLFSLNHHLTQNTMGSPSANTIRQPFFNTQDSPLFKKRLLPSGNKTSVPFFPVFSNVHPYFSRWNKP